MCAYVYSKEHLKSIRLKFKNLSGTENELTVSTYTHVQIRDRILHLIFVSFHPLPFTSTILCMLCLVSSYILGLRDANDASVIGGINNLQNYMRYFKQ